MIYEKPMLLSLLGIVHIHIIIFTRAISSSNIFGLVSLCIFLLVHVVASSGYGEALTNVLENCHLTKECNGEEILHLKMLAMPE